MACQQAFTPLRASVCRYLWAKWQGTPIILACDHPSMSRQTWRPSIPLSPSVEPSIHRMHTLNLNSCFLMTKLRFQRRSSDEAASFAFDQYCVLHKYLRNLYTRDIQMATSFNSTMIPTNHKRHTRCFKKCFTQSITTKEGNHNEVIQHRHFILKSSTKKGIKNKTRAPDRATFSWYQTFKYNFMAN